jgi:hypothetical protein
MTQQKVIIISESFEMPRIRVMHIRRVNTVICILIGYSSTIDTVKRKRVTIAGQQK